MTSFRLAIKLLMKYGSLSPGCSIWIRVMSSSNFWIYSAMDVVCFRWWKFSRELWGGGGCGKPLGSHGAKMGPMYVGWGCSEGSPPILCKAIAM
jgi:hypothetical protein